MNEDRLHEAETARLSEDAAERLLLRAIELDHSRSSETTVNELRDIAREAGISVHAFDAAFREFQMQAPATEAASPPTKPEGFFGRLRNRMRGHANPSTIGDIVVSNAIAATLFWVSMFLLMPIAQPFGWQAVDGTMLVGCILGLGLARRLHARLVELGLMGQVAFLAAELAMHLLYGIRAVQGGPTHFAVMIAGTLGATIAWAVRREPHRPADPFGHATTVPSGIATEHAPAGTPPNPERHTRSILSGPGFRGASFAHHAPAG